MTRGPSKDGTASQLEEGSRKRLLAKRGGAAYQGTVEAVFALLLGTGLGFWIDQRFDSSPWGLFLGTGFGFGAFFLRLWRLRRVFENGNTDAGAQRE